MVKKSDFEVMDALEMDLIPQAGSKSIQSNKNERALFITKKWVNLINFD